MTAVVCSMTEDDIMRACLGYEIPESIEVNGIPVELRVDEVQGREWSGTEDDTLRIWLQKGVMGVIFYLGLRGTPKSIQTNCQFCLGEHVNMDLIRCRIEQAMISGLDTLGVTLPEAVTA